MYYIIQPYYFQIELSIFWSEAHDDITHQTHTYNLYLWIIRYLYNIFTLEMTHNLSLPLSVCVFWPLFLFLSLSLLCLHDAWCACIGDCGLVFLFILFIKIHFTSHYLSSFTIHRTTNVHYSLAMRADIFMQHTRLYIKAKSHIRIHNTRAINDDNCKQRRHNRRWRQQYRFGCRNKCNNNRTTENSLSLFDINGF